MQTVLLGLPPWTVKQLVRPDFIVFLIHTFTATPSSTLLCLEDWYILGKRNKPIGHRRSPVRKLRKLLKKRD